MPLASVRFDNVRKSYGLVEVLHGISVEIQDGEFAVIAGPSGCGKSTLLRMLAGLEEIDDGDMFIGDAYINPLPSQKRNVAMVFQNYALYPHMTVAQNMGFSLKLASHPKAEIAKRVAEAAEILDLTSLLKRRPRQLSGGQRQRVAMGRAIVRDPAVFLFDEPLSNLDAKLRAQMRSELKALHQRLGTTSLYVTHDQVEAMTMADRIVVMNDGRIEQVGTPMQLYDHPANLFVAEFIGTPTMNVLHGRLAIDSAAAATAVGTALVLDDGVRIPLEGMAVSLQENHPVSLGIRSEDITLLPLPVPEEAGVNALIARVLAIEPAGPETLIIAEFGETQLTISSKNRVALTRGDAIALQLHRERLHLFDGESSQRIDGVRR